MTQTWRPTTFDNIIGQPAPITVIKAVVQRPEKSDRVYMFYGHYGCGKTTLARVFARALNCEKGGVEPCGLCKSCQYDINFAPYYQEYDCASVGSKDDVNLIKDTLILDSSLARYRVVVFDEFHRASPQAQSTLLKVLEELSSNTFVVFCTTEPDKVLNTIHSRAVPLAFSKLSEDDMIQVLSGVAQKAGISITIEELGQLVKASGGHARDAVKTLGLVESVGVDVALQGYMAIVMVVRDILKCIKTGDRDQYQLLVEKASKALRSRFKDVLYMTVYHLLQPDTEPELTELWGSDAFRLFKLLMQPWVTTALKSDETAASFLWVMWSTFSKRKVAGSQGGRSQASQGRSRFAVPR